MKITFFSFFMTSLWCTVLILGIYLCRKMNFFIKQFGIVSVFLLYLFVIIRMLLPVDFPFSMGIYVDGPFNIFFESIYLIKFDFGWFKPSLFDGFLIVWLTVFSFLTVKFVIGYRKSINAIKFSETPTNERYTNTLDKVRRLAARNVNVEMVHSKDIEIPMVMGIIRKKILLPERDFSESDLFNILLHEYNHIINHDLLVKLSVHFFCYFFWWNPIVYLLKRDLDQTLEIKCDLSATQKKSIDEKAEYLTCILNVLKTNHFGSSSKHIPISALLYENHRFDIIERFEFVSNYDSTKDRSKFLNVIWSSLFAVMIGLSYLLILQPRYEAPIGDIIDGVNTFSVTPHISYIATDGYSYFLILLLSNNEIQKTEITEEYALQMKSQGFEIRKESDI